MVAAPLSCGREPQGLRPAAAREFDEPGGRGWWPKLIQSLGQFTPADALAANRWPLAHPYRRLETRPAAEPASVG
jgi:hypothetical protein